MDGCQWFFISFQLIQFQFHHSLQNKFLSLSCFRAFKMTFLKILNCSNSSFHQYFHSTENCHCYLFIRNLNCFQLRNLNCFQHLKHSILHSWDDYFIDSFVHYLECQKRIHLIINHRYQIGKKLFDFDLLGFDWSINLTK